MNTRSASHRRAFTLVELLVVIGIIALLISILLPSLAKARRAAVTVACMSNLRQIGAATGMYVTDNKGMLPYSSYRSNDYSIQVSWDDLLSSYLGVKLTDEQKRSTVNNSGQSIKTVVCPGEGGREPLWGSAGRRSYAMTQTAWGFAPNHIQGVAADITENDVALGHAFRLKLTQVKAPSETFLMSEVGFNFSNQGNNSHASIDGPRQQLAIYGYLKDGYSMPAGNFGYAQELHGIRLNYLFVDGHVASYEPRETCTPARINSPNKMWTRDPND